MLDSVPGVSLETVIVFSPTLIVLKPSPIRVITPIAMVIEIAI
jgi:hypothetical protein